MVETTKTNGKDLVGGTTSSPLLVPDIGQTGVPDFTTKSGVAAYMSASSSATDWDIRYDTVKKYYDGRLPQFWQVLIEAEDLDKMTALKWKNK